MAPGQENDHELQAYSRVLPSWLRIRGGVLLCWANAGMVPECATEFEEEVLVDGIGLAEAIEMLRAEVLAAQTKAAGAAVRFPVETLTVQLKVGLTKLADGKVGFKVPFVGAELGASAGLHQETTQTVTLVLGPPVNAQGQPISVSQPTDEEKG
jgi:hypothetical protein